MRTLQAKSLDPVVCGVDSKTDRKRRMQSLKMARQKGANRTRTSWGGTRAVTHERGLFGGLANSVAGLVAGAATGTVSTLKS